MSYRIPAKNCHASDSNNISFRDPSRSKTSLIKVNKICDSFDTYSETHSPTPFHFHRKSIAKNIQTKQWISYVGISMAQSHIHILSLWMHGKRNSRGKDMRRTSKMYFVFPPLRYPIDMYVCDSFDLLKTDNGKILVLCTLSNNLWNLSAKLCLSIRVKI